MKSETIPQEKDVLKDALRSLVLAIDGLDDAVDRQVEDKQRLNSLDHEMSDIMLDRSRLAQSLDTAVARAARLEDANKEVSKRLVGAMETIRSVLDANKK
ncbi:MAG: DUF4164 domain-containing protein [Hyphomicrobiales bacterium]